MLNFKLKTVRREVWGHDKWWSPEDIQKLFDLIDARDSNGVKEHLIKNKAHPDDFALWDVGVLVFCNGFTPGFSLDLIPWKTFGHKESIGLIIQEYIEWLVRKKLEQSLDEIRVEFEENISSVTPEYQDIWYEHVNNAMGCFEAIFVIDVV